MTVQIRAFIMQQIKTILDKNGNISIPVEYQKRLGIYPGDEVLITFDSGEIRIIRSKEAVPNAQAIVRK
jgi:AbrB family looped-hinge helix DNA binding protein